VTTPRTPETLTAAHRAALLSGERDSAAGDSSANSRVNEMRQASAPDEPGAAARQSSDTFATLPIEQIDFYEHNPRQGKNPSYAELRRSIQRDGITNMLTVTRRGVDSKYVPYGGGNTRLRIAKELYAEGDQRFANLRIVIKEWPGDAQVISAHLAENELRGAITFWEKATGVDQFRIQLESETDKPASAAHLNRELKQRGLNYGVRTLQNFAYAVEHLQAIGPWLQSRAVNESIRPQVSALLALAAKLGKGAGIEAALQQVFKTHGQHLQGLAEQNDGLEAAEAHPVELNEVTLLADLASAASAQLELTESELGRMLAALAADPGISVQALQQQATPPEPPLKQSSTQGTDPGAPAQPSSVSTAQPVPLSQQKPIPGMLASVPAAAQMPEGATQSGTGPAAIHTPKRALEELNALIPLQDVLLASPLMPFGYLVDFPTGHLSEVDGVPLRDDLLHLRAALWKLLAAMSYQYDRRVMARIPDQDKQGIRWARVAASGNRDAFLDAFAKHISGTRPDDVRYLMGMNELPLVLNTPGVGVAFVRFMNATERVRKAHPDDVPEGFEPLFAD